MVHRPFLLLLLAATVFFAPGAEAAADAPGKAPAAAGSALYRCSMHPWIKSNHPGNCTICGMSLSLMSDAGASVIPGVVTLGAAQVSTLGVQTSPVTRQPLVRTLRVTGSIDDDDTRHRVLAARVSGRIEKLFVNFTGADVTEGSPLVTIYSPEMLSAQRVYVQRLKSGDSATAAERADARERLLELGLTEPEISSLEKNLQPNATVTVRAPMSGKVVTKLVYEGQYVQTADRLLEIADFSSMWFLFDAYEQDIPWLTVGQTVEITTRSVPGEVMTAPIAFIDPNFNETSRTTKVRVVLSNPHFGSAGEHHVLPHRVLAEGRVLVNTPAVLTVPRSSILDAGNGPVAYVDVDGNAYQQRSLKLGRRGDTAVEVLSGLTEGENVVTHGTLLIDAQAQLAAEAAAPSPSAAAGVPSPRTDPPMAGEDPRPTSQPRKNSSLTVLAAAASDSAAALAADDYAAYEKLFPTLTAAAKNFPALPALAPGGDLKSARRSFEPWSTAAADLLKPHRAELGLKIFQCPMAPVLGTGRWVQRTTALKNPFFGSAMLTCGEELP